MTMKKRNVASINKNSLLLFLLLFATIGRVLAQPGICQLACNDTIQVSLGVSCSSEILPDDILEGNLDPDCLGPIQVNVFDPQGNLLPTSPFVDDTYQGQYLGVQVIDLASNNFCESTVLVEDKLIPFLSCNNLQINCGIDPTPMVPPVVVPTPIILETLNGCATATISSAVSGTLTDVNISFEIAHDKVSDLSASLRSPSGTTIELFDNTGNLSTCHNPNLFVSFDDDARSTYQNFENTCQLDPAINGAFQPKSSFNALQGETANGTWSFTLCNSSTDHTATATNIDLALNVSGITIPFPVPSSVTISQTSSQLGTNEFTLEDFDNCTDAILSYSDVFEDQGCSDTIAQILYRTWTVADGHGNSRVCTDTISFLRLPAGSITYPDDFNGTIQPSLLCEELSPDPGNSIIPSIGWNPLPNGNPSPENEYYPAPNDDIVKWYGTGVPVAQGCEDISYSYTDLRVEACSSGASSACFKVLRTWTIWEACSGLSYQHLQTIKVEDSAPPVISDIVDLTISTPSTSCLADWYATVPNLADNCNPETNLTYTLHSTAGNVSYNSTIERYYLSDLPLGTHIITYTASDCCGNSEVQTINLTVEDQVPPTATCVSFLTSSLTIDGTVKVFPPSFDDLSNDNCGTVYFKVIRMEDLLGTANGSNNNQSTTTCDAENGDDNATRFGNQIYFDDQVVFCCEDQFNGPHTVVLRTFDVDPGEGPVNPNRMSAGGDLHGHFNDCMSEIYIDDKMGPGISCPADVTLQCTDDWTNLNLTGSPVAFDNCALDTITYNDVINLDPCGVGTVARVWTAVDHTGRTASCFQTITMADSIPAVVTFPNPTVLVECGEEFDLSITGQPVVSDNCRLLGINRDDKFHFFADSCLRKIIRTWTVMDLCSDSMWSDIQVIKIEDTTPPEVTGLPGDTTVSCDNIPAPAVPTILDNCTTNITLDFEEQVTAGACAQESTITRIWTATDNCDNSTTVSQVITVIDTLDPILTSIPLDVTLECDQPTPADAPIATDNCDTAVELFYAENIIPGNCTHSYVLVRTWTARDDCGNQDVATQNVTFEDTTIPVFSFVPADTLLECDEVIPNTDAIAIDNCDPAPSVILVEQVNAGVCAANQTLVRTWTATDACGNSQVATQTITIVDTTPPAISDFPLDTLVSCDTPLPVNDPTADDNCDPAPNLVFTEVRTDGTCVDDYLLTRTWVFTDACGNDSAYTQIITVVDTTAPVFSNIPVDATLECDGTPGNLIPDVTDNCDAMVEVVFMESDVVGCTGNTTVTRTWTATDNCGNTAQVSQEITFIDATPPVLNGVPADATVECDAVPTPAMVSATDACDPNVLVVFDEIRTDGVCTDSYTLTRTWTATDDCGNEVDSVQVLTVVDSTSPVFDMIPADVTLSCTDASDPSAGGMLSPPTATDNCDLMVAITFTDQVDAGACVDNSGITRTWTATDNCGNTTTSVQVISILDEEAPVITGVPDDLTVECDAIPVVATTITATDNCDQMVDIVFETTTVDQVCTDAYTLVRRWIATDNCGNESIDTQLIIVIDTIAPVLTGVPGDSTVQCSEVPDPPVIGTSIVGMDNCDQDVEIIFSQDTINRICADEFTLVRKWTAIDNCGNMTQDSQLLMLIDTVPPSLINIPPDLTVTCDRLADTTTNLLVAAFDNCDPDVDISYSENPDGQCPNTYIIFRRWIATDNCGNSSFRAQEITVLDTVPPMITCPSDITIDIRASQNPSIFEPKCDTMLNLIATATDNCADFITITNDSPFALDTTGNATGSYPIGVHVVTFTAEDRCGNISTCSTTITVRDLARPTLLCSDFEIILDPVDSLAILTPEDFISLLVDCSFDTIFFEEPYPTDTLVLDCSYVNTLFDIKITVTDTSGNSTSCTLADMTVVLPSASSNLCGSIPAHFSYITGHLYTESGVPLPDMMVYLEGGMAMEYPSQFNGRYAFGDLPTNNNYEVKPVHDLDYRAGVSTLDIILISRHLLGLQPLTSPYQLIAADVDNSGRVNTFDIIEIQKLLLYLQDGFPDNTSWRFIDAAHTFDDPADPFSSPFPEVCTINGLVEGINNLDFVGLKVGDIDGSFEAGALGGSVNRDAGILDFVVNEKELSSGQAVRVDFKAKDFNDLLGFQFTVDYDPMYLRYEGVESGELSDVHLSEGHLRQGLLPCNWYSHKSVDVDPEAVLFSLQFVAMGNTRLSEIFTLSSTLTAAEAYTDDYEIKTPTLVYKLEQPKVFEPSTFELYPNRPNPFKDETIISFQLPKASKTILTISDVSGKVLWRERKTYESGYHEVALSANELADANGVLYYQLITADEMATRKMVLVKR